MSSNRHGLWVREGEYRGMFLLLFLLLSAGVQICFGQTSKPVILKIDPPNWFTQLPNSLLLIHGEHLEHTAFKFHKTAATITQTTISPNGHWAFLTMATARAKPGTILLVATNARGSASVSYGLSLRRAVAEQPKGFSSADVMYLIMPDRFADGDLTNDKIANYRDPDDRNTARAYHGGDLRGIEDHLDYLQQMGVTTIWTTPLYDNSAGQKGDSYHGYSATDMYAVDPHLGTMEDYQALARAAHARGMKIVLDTVPNHVGAAHPWAQDSPTPDWFHGTVESHIEAQFDFGSIVDPNGSAEKRTPVLNGWFANFLPDLNQENPLVAVYLMQNAVWWVEMAGLDGIRIDTFPFVPRSFWHHYNALLHGLYPHLTGVGEVFNEDAHVTSFFAGGRTNNGSDGAYDTLLDTPFDYPMYFALRGALTHHKPMTAIADVLRQDALYPHPERLVTFVGNHDVKRFLSEPGASPAALHLAFGLLATMRGMPQLYYGDEIGMTGGDDPDNRKDFPGGFPGDMANAFVESGRGEPQQALFRWVQTMMQLRSHTPVLQMGQQQTVMADAATFAFVRSEDVAKDCNAAPKTSRYLVILNNNPLPQEVTVPLLSNAIAGCTRFNSALEGGPVGHVVAGAFKVSMPGQEIGAFLVQR